MNFFELLLGLTAGFMSLVMMVDKAFNTLDLELVEGQDVSSVGDVFVLAIGLDDRGLDENVQLGHGLFPSLHMAKERGHYKFKWRMKRL